MASTGTITGSRPHHASSRRLVPSHTITGLHACKYSPILVYLDEWRWYLIR